MKRLFSKKGMTLVELIIVIAIIAILLAIIIPIFSTSSSYEKEARENARAFYSNVQQIMVDEKFKETVLNEKSINNDATATKDNDKYTLIYAVVNADASNIDDRITVYVAFQNADTEIEDTSPGFRIKTFGDVSSFHKIDTTDTSTDKLKEFGNSLKKLLSSNNDSCYYYAVIDNKYRVASTCYSRYADYSSLNGNTFSKDERVTDGSEEYIVGAYPYFLCSQNEHLFRDPNEKA